MYAHIEITFMFILSLFLLLALGVGIGVLWFYSGPKSDQIKTILKQIFTNLKQFLGNIKDLALIIKDLIQGEPAESNEVVDLNLPTENSKELDKPEKKEPEQIQSPKSFEMNEVDNKIPEINIVQDDSPINSSPIKSNEDKEETVA